MKTGILEILGIEDESDGLEFPPGRQFLNGRNVLLLYHAASDDIKAVSYTHLQTKTCAFRNWLPICSASRRPSQRKRSRTPSRSIRFPK